MYNALKKYAVLYTFCVFVNSPDEGNREDSEMLDVDCELIQVLTCD